MLFYAKSSALASGGLSLERLLRWSVEARGVSMSRGSDQSDRFNSGRFQSFFCSFMEVGS
jgi:hypothetical protein